VIVATGWTTVSVLVEGRRYSVQ